MTIEEVTELFAKEKLLLLTEGKLEGSGGYECGYTRYSPAYPESIVLDGTFTVKAVEAILVWMKHYGK